MKRLWDKADKNGPIVRPELGNCWIWNAHADKDGYGIFWFNRRNHPAHRVSWMITNGKIPKNKDICHRCDVPSCIRPDHLFIGSRKDNMEDCVQKKRIAVGEANGNRKLTEQEVLEIRFNRQKGTTLDRLAKIYKVHRGTIKCIVYRKTWRHLI